MKKSEKTNLLFKQLGMNIQKLREEKYISLETLSIKTGIRKEYLKKIEQGEAYRVKLDAHLAKIAKIMNVNLSKLFYFNK